MTYLASHLEQKSLYLHFTSTFFKNYEMPAAVFSKFEAENNELKEMFLVFKQQPANYQMILVPTSDAEAASLFELDGTHWILNLVYEKMFNVAGRTDEIELTAESLESILSESKVWTND